ncbi:GLUT4 regulating protein TUG-domain-containing protein [Cadophora sp. MPI-SDFR-AT-0126]|nr:GLUT4 regulating protein TUG-domain-containing protein [Leotiomycetes sp. MPI-SDFR-AT-0126]
MASNVVVLDSSFRRAVIKVNPGTYMTDVLEQACKKLNLKASNYGLKHNNKLVELSSPYRQTGLVPGAKLELVVASRSPSVVSVALQLPESVAGPIPGGRLIDKFPSDTTLWLILRKFESKDSGQNLNFTARGITQIDNGGATGAGRIFYEMPTLNIMGREFSDFGGLQKNLAQLGFKATDQPLEEAMKEIGQYFKEEAAPSNEVSKESKKELETVTDAIAKLPSNEAEDVHMGNTDGQEVRPSADAAPGSEDAQTTPLTPSKRPAPSESSPEAQIVGPDQRPIQVYAAPTDSTPKAALRPDNEDDYEPTVAHAKLHQSRLQENSFNKRLPSDAEQERLEQEKALKLAKKTQVTIKIRFPDQQSTVATFTAAETGNSLYSFVTALIAAETQPFKLVYKNPGPQAVPRSEKLLIRDLGFEERVLVDFVWEDAASEEARKRPVLKSQYVEAAKEIPVLEPPKDEPKEEVGAGTGEASVDKGKGKENPGGGKSKGGVPKWFKGLGKK